MRKRWFSSLLLILYLFCRMDPAISDDTAKLLRDYIQLNTVNPPGNEIIAARYLATILEGEGIEYEILESAPGRGNLWARLKGGSEPGILLMHHMDVVSAD